MASSGRGARLDTKASPVTISDAAKVGGKGQGVHAPSVDALEALTVAIAAGSLTVRHLAALYLSERRYRVQQGTLSADGFTNRARYVELFADFCGQKPVHQIGNEDLIRFLALHPEWPSPHTKSDVTGAIVGLFKWCYERGYVTGERRLTKPRGMWLPPQPRKAISPEQYRAILQLCRQSNGVQLSGRRKRPSASAFRLALMFLWETGARTKEMRTAQWDELDWQNGLIVTERHKGFAKTGLPRIIPLTNRALRLIRLIAKHRLNAGLKLEGVIFRGGRGRAWTKGTFGDQFRAYADAAGVPPKVTAYSIRHGVCVRGIEANKSERQIADLLGQASTRYVAWYGRTTRTNTTYLRQIAEEISKPPRKMAPSIEKPVNMNRNVRLFGNQ